MKRLPRVFAILAAFSIGSFLAGPAQALTRERCLALGMLSLPDTTITSVRLVSARPGLPENCRVLGTLETEIRFELRLPTTTWNGKLYHQGSGGFVGSIPSAFPALGRGYATVATDAGHAGGSGDGSWALHRPDRQLNFAHRAVHLVTVVAQQIVTAAYGQAPSHSYFQGCSTGGRQALMEAQRYPSDFDGIIAGAPQLDFTGQVLGSAFNQQARAAAPIPAAKLSLLASAVLAQCDAKDGLRDGLVDNPRRCAFDPGVLECPNGDAPDCLTSAQLEAVRRIYAGPVDAAGAPLHPGIPPGSEGGADGWISLQYSFNTNVLRYFVFSDPAYDPLAFDMDRDLAEVEALSDLLDATDPDLSAFRARGGKLILWHGWADPGITAYRTVQYYNDVVRALGSNQDVAEFLRLFLAPGMYHCGGGPGLNSLDALSALENWVEADITPDAILAAHLGNGMPRTRPLCAYPSIAVWDGRGDPDDAAHFDCRTRGLGYALKGFESGR